MARISVGGGVSDARALPDMPGYAEPAAPAETVEDVRFPVVAIDGAALEAAQKHLDEASTAVAATQAAANLITDPAADDEALANGPKAAPKGGAA